MLFDRIDVHRPVAGGGGGIGSVAILLARQLTDLTVIATAPRPETRAWAQPMGAHHVLDHATPLPPQVEALGSGAPALVFSSIHSDRHRRAIAELIASKGRFGLIHDPDSFDIVPFKAKPVSIYARVRRLARSEMTVIVTHVRRAERFAWVARAGPSQPCVPGWWAKASVGGTVSPGETRSSRGRYARRKSRASAPLLCWLLGRPGCGPAPTTKRLPHLSASDRVSAIRKEASFSTMEGNGRR
jgi:hypothetical protein